MTIKLDKMHGGQVVGRDTATAESKPGQSSATASQSKAPTATPAKSETTVTYDGKSTTSSTPKPTPNAFEGTNTSQSALQLKGGTATSRTSSGKPLDALDEGICSRIFNNSFSVLSPLHRGQSYTLKVKKNESLNRTVEFTGVGERASNPAGHSFKLSYDVTAKRYWPAGVPSNAPREPNGFIGFYVAEPHSPENRVDYNPDTQEVRFIGQSADYAGSSYFYERTPNSLAARMQRAAEAMPNGAGALALANLALQMATWNRIDSARAGDGTNVPLKDRYKVLLAKHHGNAALANQELADAQVENYRNITAAAASIYEQLGGTGRPSFIWLGGGDGSPTAGFDGQTLSNVGCGLLKYAVPTDGQPLDFDKLGKTKNRQLFVAESEITELQLGAFFCDSSDGTVEIVKAGAQMLFSVGKNGVLDVLGAGWADLAGTPGTKVLRRADKDGKLIEIGRFCKATQTVSFNTAPGELLDVALNSGTDEQALLTVSVGATPVMKGDIKIKLQHSESRPAMRSSTSGTAARGELSANDKHRNQFATGSAALADGGAPFVLPERDANTLRSFFAKGGDISFVAQLYGHGVGHLDAAGEIQAGEDPSQAGDRPELRVANLEISIDGGVMTMVAHGYTDAQRADNLTLSGQRVAAEFIRVVELLERDYGLSREQARTLRESATLELEDGRTLRLAELENGGLP